MGMEVIRALTPRLRRLAARYQCRCVAKMVTNGLALTFATARELVVEQGVIHFDITLDGTAEFHDARRQTKRNVATFDKIYRNLEALCRSSLEMQVTLRCNVDARNADGVAPLLEKLAADGLQRQLSFYATYVYSWSNRAHELALPIEEFARRQIEWQALAWRLGFPQALLPARKRVVCMAVRLDAELIDARGNLFNCTETSYVPANGEPNLYQIGTARAGAEAASRARLQAFNDRVLEGQYECHKCRMLPVCGGSCPKDWLEGRARCPSAHYNIERRLLLEYAATRTAPDGSVAAARRAPVR